MKFKSKSVEDTKKIAEMFSQNVFPFSNILLFWEVWAWKTHFIKFLLNKLWVEWQIKSPTFSYSNFYQIAKTSKTSELRNSEKSVLHDLLESHFTTNIWHYDIYRLKPWEELEWVDEHFFSNDLVICEWAEKLKSKPENRVEITFKKIWESEREIDFNFIWTSLSDAQVNRLYEFYKTPEHVKKHIAVVTNVATRIAENLIKKWILVDKWLVISAARIHDLVRYVDFKWWITREKIPYEVDDETFDFWIEFSEECKGKHHADVARDIMYDLWYPEIWKVIESHKSEEVFKWLNTIEEKIVYYSDKRALHDKFVTIKERLEDWKIRYFREWSDDYWNKLEKALFGLEKELMVDF